jgi:heat shock protein HslJ
LIDRSPNHEVKAMNSKVDSCWQRHALHLVAPLAMLFLSACATPSGGSRYIPELAGTSWVVTRIDGRAPLGRDALSADFGVDGRLNGDSGCNHYSGPFIQDGSTVRVGELLSTRRACVDTDQQRQESRVLAILQGEAIVRYERDRLSVRSSSGTLELARADNSVVRSGVVPGGVAVSGPRQSVLDCEGIALTVVYAADSAELSWNDGRDVLRQRPVTTGAAIWYESDRNSLRSTGRGLEWTQSPRAPRDCRELR